MTLTAASNAAAQQDAATTRSGSFDHRAAWIFGIVAYGVALVMAGLGGSIALRLAPGDLRLEPDGEASAQSLTAERLGASGVVGLIALGLAALLFALSLAARQHPKALPAWLRRVVRHLHGAVRALGTPFGEGQHALPDHGLGPISLTVTRAAVVVGLLLTGLAAMMLTGLGLAGGLAAIGVSGTLFGVTGLITARDHLLVHIAVVLAGVVLIASTARDTRWTVVPVAVAGALVAVLAILVTRGGPPGWRRLATMTVGAAAIVSFALLDELDKTLKSLTLPGNPRRGFSGLVPSFNPLAAHDRIAEVGSNWYEFRHGQTVTAPSDFTIRWAYILLDSAVLAIAYPLLLYVLARAIALRLDGDGAEPRLRKSMLTVAQFSMPVLVAIDVAENVTGTSAVQPYAGIEAPSKVTAIAGLLAVAHSMLHAMKWLIVIGASIAIVVGAAWLMRRPREEAGEFAWQAAPTHRRTKITRRARGPNGTPPPRAATAPAAGRQPSARSTAAGRIDRLIARVAPTITGDQPSVNNGPALRAACRVLRGHIVIVVVLALAMRNDQSYDAFRSMANYGGDAWLDLSAAAALLFALFTLAILFRITGRALATQTVVRSDLDARARVGVMLLMLGVALVMWFWLDAPGLLIPVGIMIVLELVSIPLRGTSSRSAREFIGSIGPRLALCGVLLVAGWVASFTYDSAGVRWLLFAAGAVVAIQALITLRADLARIPPPDPALARAPHVRACDEIARLITALTGIVVGAAMARSAIGLVIYRRALQNSVAEPFALVALAAMAVAIGIGVAMLRGPSPRRALPAPAGIAVIELALALIFCVYLLCWQVLSIDEVMTISQKLGAIGVLLLAAALFTILTAAISYLAETTRPLPALRLIGFRHTPYYTLIIVWLLVANTLDNGGYHSILVVEATARISATEGAAGLRGAADGEVLVTSEKLFKTWERECLTEESPDAVPMIFVAASGGGVRAAYWTALALTNIERQIREAAIYPAGCSPIIAISGASGGSLGAAVYTADRLADAPDVEISDRLGSDLLAPVVASLVFTDAIRPFFLWDGDGEQTRDRADVLVDALLADWEPAPARPTEVHRCDATTLPNTVSMATGLRSAWCLGGPLLILNGTEVGSACRYIASVFDNGEPDDAGDPTAGNCHQPPDLLEAAEGGTASDDFGPLGATIDLVDSLCADQDVGLATGALLSARFPFVSPSGRVPACDGDEGRNAEEAFVVDGGYIDNSGAGSLVELWSHIGERVDSNNSASTVDGRSCIVPVFVQIDNGYDFDSATPAGRPWEMLVPFTTAMGASRSREAQSKQLAAEIFGPAEFSGDLTANNVLTRWIRIVPEAHPGVQAPIGWILSDAARRDLRGEIANDFPIMRELPEDNRRATGGTVAAQLQQFFSANLDCAHAI